MNSRARFPLVKLSLFLVFLILPNNLAQAGIFGYRDFCDCVLKEMDGVYNDRAAGFVILECQKKFSDRRCKSRKNSFFSISVRECILRHGKNISGAVAESAVAGMCVRVYGN